MARIPQSFIDEVLARTDIVELIDARVPLKRAGHEFKACCPFHQEKTPSFYVSPKKQFFHCFGCGAHGTAIGFLMDYERLSFFEAIETLAEQLGLKVPLEGAAAGAPRKEGRSRLYEVLEAAAQWYRQQLSQHSAALGYLGQRGVDEDAAERFRIGYAPASWDGLRQELGSRFSLKELEEAGLLARKNDHVYDRFRDRIMFPIRDAQGRTIGFGGRVLGEGAPKYLNSNETSLFHKGRELYGLYEARQARQSLDRVLIVEGYMDVIGLAQAGVANVVATLGTATTAEHLQRLYRLTSRLVFCFDGDRAGRQAAWRALEQALLVLSDEREAFFLFLPEGQDPDSYVRHAGAEAFQSKLEKATPLSEFLIEGLVRRHPGSSMEARATLLSEAASLLSSLDAGALRDQIIDALALELRMNPERVGKFLAVPSRKPAIASALKVDREQGVRLTPVRTAIALLLMYPQLFADISAQAVTTDDDAVPGVDLLRSLLETVHANPHMTTAALLERWRGRPEHNHLAKLLEWSDVSMKESQARKVFLDAIARIRQQSVSKRLENLLALARKQGLNEAQKRELNALLRARTAAGH